MILASLFACGASRTGPAITVIARAGDEAEPGASVVASRADGSLIESSLPDATGRATIHVEPDALITVQFPSGDLLSYPAIDGMIVHGPPHETTPVVAAVIAIEATPITADQYVIDLGCASLHLPLPANINVAASCFGRDTTLDVLVRAFSAGQLAGSFAARFTPLDGFADITPVWQTAPPTIPVTGSGTLDWVLVADGLPFGAQPLGDRAPLWSGLAIDGAVVHGMLDARSTTLAVSGVPSTIDLGPYLPVVAPSLAVAGQTVSWTPDGLGDAVDVHFDHWDVVLPPDTSSITLPELVPLGTATLRYVDSSLVADFASITELSTATILPAGGTLRVSEAR